MANPPAVVKMALEWDGPVYLRMKRPETTPEAFEPLSLEIGKGLVRRAGSDITILTAGILVAESLKAADALAADGIDACVVDMASLKPIDADMIIERAQSTGAIVTAENHSIIGGLGSAAAEVLMEAGVSVPFRRVGVQDQFCEGGTTPYLLNKFGLDSTAIAAACRTTFELKP